jgi:hypothetical protein
MGGKKTMRMMVLFALGLCGCGASLAGLKDTAAKDLNCEAGDLDTSRIREGYAPDGFGARVEVSGCGNRAEYEKKGPKTWMLVTEVEPIKEGE